MWFRSLLAALRPARWVNRSHRRNKSARRREARRLLFEPLDARRVLAFSPFSDTPMPNWGNVELAGDFTGDGQADLVVGNWSSFQLFVATGGGDFAPPETLALTGWSVAAGDLNADGNLDLVTSSSIALGNGDGTFQAPTAISLPPMTPAGYHSPVPQYPGSVAVGDINNDGTLDLAVTGRSTIRVFTGQTGEFGEPIYNTYTSGHANVLLGNGDGTLQLAIVSEFPRQSTYEATALAQLSDDNGDSVIDADDNLDLMVKSGDTYSNGNVLLGQGNGSLWPATSFPYTLFHKLLLGDFDEDGQLDLLTHTTTGLQISRGLPGGAFAPPTALALGGPTSAPRSVAVGDINADGNLDISVTTQRASVGGSYYDEPFPDSPVPATVHDAVKVILGNGDGTFSAPITSPLGVHDGLYVGDVHSSVLADVNGDGRLDLALTDIYQSRMTLALNDGIWMPPAALYIEDVTIVEGDSGQQLAVFTVTTTGDHAGVTVDYATQDDSFLAEWAAAAGQDYTATAGTLTFAASQDTQTISVPILGDRGGEWWESFYVMLSNPSGAILVDGQALGTIQDNEPTVSINHPYGIDPLTVVEGDGVNVPAVFTVTLSAPYDAEITVDYYTLTGHTSDIISQAATLHFAPGETSRDITVQVVGDLIDEPLEAFNVYLGSSPNAIVVSGAGYCYIEDNDPSPTITISDVTKNEGNSRTTRFAFTVRLSAPADNGAYVSYATASGTATANQDYVAKSGTIYFAPGQTTATITIDVKGDKTQEADETFFVNLTSPSGATIADSQGVGTIMNDDGGGKSSGGSHQKLSASAVDAAIDALIFSARKKRGR